METDKCNKVSFGSKKFADDYLAILQKKSNRKNVPVRSYECDKCGSWHLTSQLFSFEEKDKIKETIKQLTKTIKELADQNKVLLAKNETLTTENQKLSKQNKLSKADKKEIREKSLVEQLMSQNKSLQKRIKELKDQRDNLIANFHKNN